MSVATPPSKERQIANSAIYLAPVIVGSLAPIVTLPILTRILSAEQYGAWGLATVYAVFATGIGNLGLTIGFERNFFQHTDPGERAALLYSVLAFVGATLVTIGAATWLFREPLARWIVGSPNAGTLLFCAYCAQAVVSFKAYYLIYFRNCEHAKAYAWFSIDETILSSLFAVFFIAYLRTGPIGLVLGNILASSLVLGVVIRRVARVLKPAFSRALLGDALLISLPLTPRIFLGVVGSNFDRYMIGLLATVGGVGVYTIGQRLSYVAFQYMTAIENVFAPHVYQQMFARGQEGADTIGRYLTPFAYASVAVSLLIALFSEELLLVLTPSAYHGAIPVVSLLVVSYGIMLFAKMPQLSYARKTFVTSLLTLLSLGLNVAFNIVLIRRWGAVGAAYGTAAAGLVAGAIGFLVRQHYYPIRWEYRKLAVMFGLFIGGALAAEALRSVGGSYWIRLVVKTGFVGAFIWLGVQLRYLSRENVALVRNVGRRRFGSEPAEATV